jgi:hypothetical protein
MPALALAIQCFATEIENASSGPVPFDSPTRTSMLLRTGDVRGQAVGPT